MSRVVPKEALANVTRADVGTDAGEVVQTFVLALATSSDRYKGSCGQTEDIFENSRAPA